MNKSRPKKTINKNQIIVAISRYYNIKISATIYYDLEETTEAESKGEIRGQYKT